MGHASRPAPAAADTAPIGARAGSLTYGSGRPGGLAVVAYTRWLGDSPAGITGYSHGIWVPSDGSFTALDAIRLYGALKIDPTDVASLWAAHDGTPLFGGTLDPARLATGRQRTSRPDSAADLVAGLDDADRAGRQLAVIGDSELNVRSQLQWLFRDVNSRDPERLADLYFTTWAAAVDPAVRITGLNRSEAADPASVVIDLRSSRPSQPEPADPAGSAPSGQEVRPPALVRGDHHHQAPACPACAGTLARVRTRESAVRRLRSLPRTEGPNLSAVLRSVEEYACRSCQARVSSPDAPAVLVVGPPASGKTSLIAAIPMQATSDQDSHHLITSGPGWSALSGLASGRMPASSRASGQPTASGRPLYEVQSHRHGSLAVVDADGDRDDVAEHLHRIVGRINRGLVVCCVPPGQLRSWETARDDRPGTPNESAEWIRAMAGAIESRTGWQIAVALTKTDRLPMRSGETGAAALQRLGGDEIREAARTAGARIYATAAAGCEPRDGHYPAVRPHGNTQLLNDWLEGIAHGDQAQRC